MLSWVGVIKRFRIDSVYYRDEVGVANYSGGEVSVVDGKLSRWLRKKSTSDERQSHGPKPPLRNNRVMAGGWL
jgi:hypothetical protein